MLCFKVVIAFLIGWSAAGDLPAIDSVGDLCPLLTNIHCPAIRLAKYGGDVVQLVHKLLPQDHQLAKHPEISSRQTNLICDEPAVTCPSGWTFGSDKCYLFTGSFMTWDQGQAYCEGLSGQLVGGRTRYPSLLTIDSDVETTNLLVLRAHSDDFWLNCNDLVTEGTFICQTTRDGAVGIYRNWLPTEPNDNDLGGEDCTQVIARYGLDVPGKGFWNDQACNKTSEVVCQLYTP